ncbi:hypothetical protein HYV56_01435 [Candidatus Peregrinibacteria bacterium]|nr:hypothetical protein [Candidatus Peregrinibacteria bacterium]
MFQQFLAQVGLNEKERLLYIALAEIGIQPASVVARHCRLDRVTAYKNLKKLADKGLVKVYSRDNIQCFGIESFENLQVYLKERLSQFENLLCDYPMIENLFRSLKGDQDMIPKLQIFEGEAGIKNFFRDLLFEVKSEGLHQIRMLTSNTFEERLGDVPLSKFVEDFFQEIRDRKIDFEIYEASGNLIPERFRKISFASFAPAKFPAARGTTNIFLAGHAVYLACYKHSQIGLKIKQSEISQIFHFLFDFMAKLV